MPQWSSSDHERAMYSNIEGGWAQPRETGAEVPVKVVVRVVLRVPVTVLRLLIQHRKCERSVRVRGKSNWRYGAHRLVGGYGSSGVVVHLEMRTSGLRNQSFCQIEHILRTFA